MAGEAPSAWHAQAAAAVARWREHFNRGEFYEAHEVAEEAWLAGTLPRWDFLKGLIHAAVALCHYQRGNGHGARVKYASAARYLEPYRPDCLGVDLDDLLAQMARFFRPLLRLPEGSPPPVPTVPWPVAGVVGGDADGGVQHQESPSPSPGKDSPAEPRPPGEG